LPVSNSTSAYRRSVASVFRVSDLVQLIEKALPGLLACCSVAGALARLACCQLSLLRLILRGLLCATASARRRLCCRRARSASTLAAQLPGVFVPPQRAGELLICLDSRRRFMLFSLLRLAMGL